ncbi:sensor histidine kinase [Persicitalea sp.]|uniref:sensor histidine kinase n=1 Tax=Persicitalea sp. TaxID=3100273 RepID=UPI00359342CD
MNSSENQLFVLNDRWVRIFAVPIIGFLVPLLFFGEKMENGLTGYLPLWLVSAFYTFIYYEGSRQIFLQVHNRFPHISQTIRRITWLAIFVLVYIMVVCTLLEMALHQALRGMPDYNHQVSLLANYMASIIPTIICLSIYEGVFYFEQYRKALLETEHLKQENVLSQLESLKSQVNPHFLFNSLNTLAALIPENADLAIEFVHKLSKVYRYILEITDLSTVSLREEVVALNAYLFLLQIRFGRNLTVRMVLPKERLDDHIVPLALQMLVDNAVKHNVSSTQRPLWIEIRLEGDQVTVQNNLQTKNNPEDSTGLGLPNIRNRYQLLVGKPIEVIVTAQTFTVSLPVLPAPAYARVAVV